MVSLVNSDQDLIISCNDLKNFCLYDAMGKNRGWGGEKGIGMVGPV